MEGAQLTSREGIDEANATLCKLSKVRYAVDINRETETVLLRALVLSAPLYGCEAWKPPKGKKNASHCPN